jgi:hypothetical protein
MALPNKHKQKLKDGWSQVQRRTEGMELDQAVHQMIPWISADDGYLENFIRSALQKYSLNSYHDF